MSSECNLFLLLCFTHGVRCWPCWMTEDVAVGLIGMIAICMNPTSCYVQCNSSCLLLMDVFQWPADIEMYVSSQVSTTTTGGWLLRT